MSRIRANQITNQAADGAPTVQNGLVISGVCTATSFSGIDTDKISEGNTEAEVVDTGSDGHFKVTTEGTERLRVNSSGLVSITGDLTIPDNIIHSGDTNTKIRFPADDTIQFETSGHDRICIKSDGKIGMGTVTPAVDIHHFSDGLNGNSIRLENREGYVTIINDANGLYLDADTHYIRSKSGSTYATINSSGRMGLGTSSVDELLHIANTGGGASILIETNASSGGNVLFGDDSSNTVGRVQYLHSDNTMRLHAGGSERLRIQSDGSCYFGPQIITEADMGWGHDAHQRPFVFSGNQAGVNPADATIVVANPNTDPPSTRLGSFMFGCKSSSAGNSGIKAYIEGWTTSNPSNTYEAGGYIKFVTRQSGGSLTEHFKIDHDGKLYKSGNHFYPLVNYTEVATFSAASVSSNSYTDLRTIYSSYTPKKAGNLIVIHHQSQLWQGGHASGNGDAMWRLLRDEGSGFSEIVKNERIMGNMDGRNYTGGSGLARHHRTVHLMGSFTCNGNNFTLKTQGKVDHTGVSLQWYHNSENILQIWEYEKG